MFVEVQLETSGFVTIAGLYLPQPGGQDNARYISSFPQNTAISFSPFLACLTPLPPYQTGGTHVRGLTIFVVCFIPLLIY